MNDRFTLWSSLIKSRFTYRAAALAVAILGSICVPFAAPMFVLCVGIGCIFIELWLLSIQRRRGGKLKWQNVVVFGMLFAISVTAGAFPWWCLGSFVSVDLKLNVYSGGRPLTLKKLSFTNELNGVRVDTFTDESGVATVTLDAMEWDCSSVLGISSKRLELFGIGCQLTDRHETRIWLSGRRIPQHKAITFWAAPYRLVVRRVYRNARN